MNIPIVVAAYNRKSSLKRLLDSLLKAEYERSVKLIISIDGGGSSDVCDCAESFDWFHGEKEVVIHKENLGLREHILFCGGLAKEYDGIVLLEDDLYVSPWFYQYGVEAAEFYHDSREVAGVALYSPSYNESARLPFYPLNDGSDVYFMQVACSWGQLWLRQQWQDFEEWYERNSKLDLSEDTDLPYEIRHWPDSSWKKYFIKYLIETKRYFVYPRSSFTTNFGDMGQHHKGTQLHQVPLQLGKNKNANFFRFSDSFVKYDVFCEIIPESLIHLGCDFDEGDFVVDLYGIKEKHCLTGKYVLTAKPCEKTIYSFGRYLTPIEYNIVDSIEGNDLFYSLADDVCPIDESDFRVYIYTKCATLEEQKYFYNISNLHYFIFNKEIKKQKRIVEMKNEKIEHLNDRIKNMHNKLDVKTNSINDLGECVEQIRNSLSYRVGNKIIYPLSMLKKIGRGE